MRHHCRAARNAMSSLPETKGSNEIVQEAGRGSLGTLHPNFEPFSGRLSAINVAHPTFTNQGENGRHIRACSWIDAHAAASLDHANVLGLLHAKAEDHGGDPGIGFVADTWFEHVFVLSNRLQCLRGPVGAVRECAQGGASTAGRAAQPVALRSRTVLPRAFVVPLAHLRNLLTPFNTV